MARLRIDLQIEETSPLVRQLIGSAKGAPDFNAVDPDKIVKVLYTPNSAGINEINPGIYYSIPSITTAKEGDTALSDDGRFFVYEETGSRWFLWYTFDLGTVKIHTNNTLRGDGSLEDPLSVNTNLFSLKGDINPLLKGVDNGDGTYTFTSVDGNTMFNVDVGDRFVYYIGELRSTAGRHDGERIDVIGYYLDTPGVGGGRFFWDEDSTETDNNGTIIEVTGQPAGRWKRVHDGQVSGYWFGLRGDGAGDETVKIQEFFDHIGEVSYDSALIEGDYRISNTIYVGPPGGGAYRTRIIYGSPRFEALGPIGTMIGFYNLNLLQVKDIWTVTGTTIRSYSSRASRIEGVRIEGCKESKFAGFRCSGFRDSGVVFEGTPSNNNMSYVGFVEGVNIGSGAPQNSWTNSLTAEWSNPVNYGAPTAIGQYTEIDVDTMPDAVEREYILAFIEGEYYIVRQQFPMSNKIRVFPQIPPSVDPGMLVYHYGAALTITGTDSNVLKIESINATRCGSAIDMISPYGPNVDRIVAQVCGTLITIGRETSSVMDTINVNLAYYEDNTSDIIVVPEGGFSSWVFGANINLNLSKVHKIVRLDNLSATDRLVINYNGKLRSWEKHSNNWRNTRDTTAISFSEPNKIYTLRRNSVTILLAPSENYNKLFGYDTVWVAIQGSGDNNSPTGSIYFQSKRGDNTYRLINGQDSATPIEFTPDTFHGAAFFICHWLVGSDQLFVAPVSPKPPLQDLQSVTDEGFRTSNPVAFRNSFTNGNNTYEAVQWRDTADGSAGFIAVRLPNISNGRIVMEINLFSYSAPTSAVRGLKYFIKGYAHSSGIWLGNANSAAGVIGTVGPASTLPQITFALDGNGDKCILIGNTSTRWARPSLSITRIETEGDYDTSNIDISLLSDDSEFTDTSTPTLNRGVLASWEQGILADTAIQPGDNISHLTNDANYIDSSGAPVQSVNGDTGAVVLDADDIDDTSTANKFVTAAEKSDIATAVQPGDLATIATTGDSTDLTDSANLIRNDQDTYVSEPKVVQIITLTEAEKDAIVTPVVGALYIVPEP